MLVKFFQDLDKESVKEAGGKGASLGEMIGAGMPVPPGFVVLSEAFDRFLEETDLNVEIEAVLDELKQKHDDVNAVEEASEKIRDMMRREEMPKDLKTEILKNYKKLGADFVAVRSSATAEDSKVASWAGELETFLNVTEKDLTQKVMTCWSSLFTPRAIFYRFEKKLHNEQVSVAVVVQEMAQSEVAGICFTVHPVTEDRNQMVIEAGFGLGEAVVSGSVTPDTYVVHKDDFTIVDVNISEQKFAIVKEAQENMEKQLSPDEGSKQKLPGKQIVELAKLCKDIEKHYGAPQDIEWAWVDGKFYITQSRPITTLKQ